MKPVFVLLALLISNTASADCNQTQYGCSDLPKEKTTQATIFLSCSGITFDIKNAVHLTVTELAPNKLVAVVHASNGETITVPMRHGFGTLIPADSTQYFGIYLNHLNKPNGVMLNWDSNVLNTQFSHLAMTCAEKQRFD